MIGRREFIAGLGGVTGAVTWPLAALAQQRNQIKRIAFIIGAVGTVEAPIKQELAKLGWVEGRNVRACARNSPRASPPLANALRNPIA